MDEKDYLETFIHNLFYYLTGLHLDKDEISIFKKHTNKLDATGDISFPLNISAWKKYLNTTNTYSAPIFEYLIENKIDLSNALILYSKVWSISIENCCIEHEKFNIFLNRPVTFKYIVTDVLLKKKDYGSSNMFHQIKIEMQLENNEDDISIIDLTLLRLRLLRNVVNNLLQMSDNDNNSTQSQVIYLTNKSEGNIENKKIVCGVVIGNKYGKKITEITAEEYYCKRMIDMRLMAQHKYGVRINSDPHWADFLQKLGNAAVTYDLLHVKPSRSIVINIDNATSTHSKGASFILYNYARLSTMFKNFDKKVSDGIYPPLPDLNQIDFSLLNQHEEWELLYVYLMQFPCIIRSCIKDISECKLNVHNLCTFLDSFCALFSVYYRRIRVLMEPRAHLFPVLFARIYFLKAVYQVLNSSLALLNITPVSQM